MRDPSELSEQEVEFVNRLVVLYPNGVGYSPDRDAPIREFAAELIEEGRVERTELPEDDGGPYINYRQAPEHAEEIREDAKAKSEVARFN